MVIREIPVKSMLTKTRVPAGDYVINPYVGCPHRCVYCYADYMRRFTGHGEPWGEFLDVKIYDQNLKLNRLNGKKVVLCSVTDAYNPFEKKYGVTRKLLEQFTDSRVKVEILTKSDLVLRDLDVLKRIPDITVGVSINTLDDGIRKKLESGAPSVERRLAAIKTLTGAGINTYIFVSPILPGITDCREILKRCKHYCKKFYFENLNLRGAYRQKILQYVHNNYPHLMPLYDEIYRHKNREYWHTMEKEIGKFCEERYINWGSYFFHEKIRKN
ncbi:MAG: radical SAM protein [Treponema sp.]|jgi:DNA repair photolyase|nr:radical SAM protein [Treponema sp.]